MKKLSYSQVLMISAIAVGAPRWMGAMLEVDVNNLATWIPRLLNSLNIVSGLGMGLLEVLAIGYMLDTLRGLKPFSNTKKGRKMNIRFWGSLFFAVGILFLTPAILSPYLVAKMNAENIATTLALRSIQFAWSFAVVVVPIFIVGGVAFARDGIVAATLSENQRDVSDAQRKVSEIPATLSDVSCELCDFVGKNRYALSGHMRVHKGETNENKTNDIPAS